MKKFLSLLSSIAIAFLCNTAHAATIDDVITADLLPATSTTYVDFSNKTFTSGVVYAGNSSKANDAISLRSDKSTSGIVTTSIPENFTGVARKVVVKWNSTTTNARKIDIYGKNIPYVSAANLYSSSPTVQGTKIGTITCGTSTELEIAGDYKYIGIRSASGQCKLDEITIMWELPSAVEKPIITLSGEEPYFMGDDIKATISCDTEGAEIYYTTNGDDPTTASTKYDGEFSISSATTGSVTIKAIAIKGRDESNLASKDLTINKVVTSVAEFNNNTAANELIRIDCDLTVSFAKNGQAFAEDGNGDAIFLYSKNLKDIEIENGKVFPARGLKGIVTTYNTNKELNFSNYTIPELKDGTPIEPIVVQFGALSSEHFYKYVKVPDVKLTAQQDNDMYTVNGEESALLNEYGLASWPKDIDGKSFDIYGIYLKQNNIANVLYFIDAQEVDSSISAPVIDVPGGEYDEVKTITITADDGAEVRYTTNNISDIKYGTAGQDYLVGKEVTIDKSCTLRVIALKGDVFSNVVAETYTMKTAAPIIEASEAVDGAYNNEKGKLSVTLKSKYTENVTVTYTVTDASGISEDNSINELPATIIVNGTATVTATALYGNFEKSDEATASFKWNDPNTILAEGKGDIVIKDQDDNKFIASGNMQKDKTYILTDNLGTEYQTYATLNSGGSGTGNTYPARRTDGTLRLYSSGNNELFIINNDIIIKKVEIYHNRTSITINDSETASANGVSIWETEEEACHEIKIVPSYETSNTDISKIAITYMGKRHYDKVSDGESLLAMEAGRYYEINTVLQGIKVNDGVLYACTTEESAAPSIPNKSGFDNYEDRDWEQFDQRDWVAIDGAGSDYEGSEISTGFIANYDGNKLIPVNNLATNGEAASYELNTYRPRNIIYGNYENIPEDDYKAFYVKAKVNEVANFEGLISADGYLYGDSDNDKINGQGIKIVGIVPAVSTSKNRVFEGILVNDANYNHGVKIIATGEAHDATGVESLNADRKATIYGTEGAVIVIGAEGNVDVFDAMGRMLKSEKSNGSATVEMPAGYYIVRTAGTAKAVIVK